MAIVKQVVGTPAAITVSGLSTLAASAYATSNTKDNTANQPMDLLVQLSVTSGTVSGTAPQVLLFALASLDNATFQTGADSTNEANMQLLGTIMLAASNSTQVREFSVASAFGFVLPPYTKFVVKNSTGAALTNGSLTVSEISNTVA